MNLFYILLTSILLSFSSGIPYSSVEKAFEANNASEIVKLGEDKLLFDLLGKEGVYSQSQAGLVLKEFFTNNPGNSFDFVFKGQESIQGAFAIGNYVSKGNKFRVTIHFIKSSDTYNIESLTIEKN